MLSAISGIPLLVSLSSSASTTAGTSVANILDSLLQPWVAWFAVVVSVGGASWIVAQVFGRRRELRHSRDMERIRVILDELPEGVTILDSQGRIQWMSESTHRLFGWDVRMAKGRSAFELVHPDDRQRMIERFSALQTRPGQVDTAEFRFQRADGGWIPIEVTARNLRDVEGIAGILISGRDLSESSLVNHQLEEAKLHAERLLAEKNEFVAILGHEVRTPLQAIYAALDVVNRQIPVGDSSREMVEHAARSAESLLQILDDLLVMSRAESKLVPVRRVSFDPAALSAEIVGLFDVPARKNGGSIRLVVPAGSDRMQGDPARLRQVLSNLVGNAVRYAGHAEIEVAYQEIDRHAVWEVRDRGPGLEEGDASRLFRKWERGREDVPGSGLGLSIVADIVQSMSGALQAFPREGGGLLVRVRLPMMAPDATGSDPHLERSAPIVPGNARKPRVLVAEDDRTNQIVIRRQLENLDCHPVIAPDGAVALSILEKEEFDLILLDCQMPVMDGFTAAREIRRRESEKGAPRLPVLAVTAWAMQEDRDHCLRSGMDEVLTKPLRPAELADALSRWIGHRRN